MIITSVISVILVSLLFVGSTYSIFTSGDTEEDLNVYTTGNLDISYTLSSDKIVLNSNTPIRDSDSYLIEPYRITVTNNGTVPYQFNLMLVDTTASDVIDYNYIMTKVGKFDSKKLALCNKNIIKDGIIVSAGSSVDIDVRVWLSDDVINSEVGKSFYSKLSIDGIAIYDDNGGYDNSNLVYPISDKVISNYIENLYKEDSVKIDTGINDNNVIVSLNNNKNIMLDNNGDYRYYGSNPKNYVSYNNELWRIISVSHEYYDEDDIVGSKRVKLIRDNSLGKYSLNDNIMDILNDLYYEGKDNFSKIGLDKVSRDFIDSTLFKLNVGSIASASDSYNLERNNKCDNCKMASNVGLIYLSDYMYATDYSEYEVGNYYNNNWLYNKDSNIVTIDGKNLILGDGKIVSNSDISSFDVYPVVYLKSDVVIISGDGSRNNPYKLSLSIDVD